MANYKRLLVVITPEREEQPALKRAVLLANEYDAELVLASTVYNRNIEKGHSVSNEDREKLKQAMMDEQKSSMENSIAKLQFSGKVHCKVTWHKKWYLGIIELAKAEECDLIVKETRDQKKTTRSLFTPDHWNLLRHSPINVLVVKNHEWVKGGNIVTAIGLDDEDEQHQYLSKQVAKESSDLAKLFNADLYFINTVTKAPVHISVDITDYSPEDINENVKKKHKIDLEKIAKELNISDVNIAVEEGLPGKVVPKLCKQLDAKCLVLGSVGRTGLDAAFLGNTAEYIIDKISCDTLIVKG